MKRCYRCKKTRDDFSRCKSSKDGLQSACKECQSAYGTARYSKKREQEYARHLAYRKNNPGKINFWSSKRHAAKLQRTPKWLIEKQLFSIQFMYLCAAEFTRQTGTKYHVDHIIPLQGKSVSGSHVPSNLQCLPASENCRKRNKCAFE